MKESYYKYLKLLYSRMPGGTDCWISENVPVEATKIVIIGSDIEAAYNGMLVYHHIKRVYGCSPMIYCCGGDHKFIPHTQAFLLKEVCLRLGASKGCLCLCSKGNSLRGTLESLYKEDNFKKDVIVYATSFREHLKIRQIVRDCNMSNNAFFCAPPNPFSNDFRDEVAYDLRWGNCMNLWNQTLLVHEMVELYAHCMFADADVNHGNNCSRIIYTLTRQLSTKSMVVYAYRHLRFKLSYFLHKSRITKAREKQIAIYQKRLKELGFNY